MPRVLIIDDDRDLLNVCSVGMHAFGHDVWTAGTGRDGLAEAAIRAPDVIVLDLGLPDMDGMEVCRRIRTWSEVPILVLSADGSEDRKVDALDDGADDYMTKPFGMRELNARLRVALRHHAVVSEDQAELDVGLLHWTWPTARRSSTGGFLISPRRSSTSSPTSHGTPGRSVPAG